MVVSFKFILDHRLDPVGFKHNQPCVTRILLAWTAQATLHGNIHTTLARELGTVSKNNFKEITLRTRLTDNSLICHSMNTCIIAAEHSYF